MRDAADELAAVLLPAMHAALKETSHAFHAAADEPSAWGDEERMRDIATRSRHCHEIGWCFGLLAAASGVDVLRDRHERGGMRALVAQLGIALGDRIAAPDTGDLPFTRARAGWQLPFLVAVVVLDASRERGSSAPMEWRLVQGERRSALWTRGGIPELSSELLDLVPGTGTVQEGSWNGLEFDSSLLARSRRPAAPRTRLDD